jgi:hypothetical protein
MAYALTDDEARELRGLMDEHGWTTRDLASMGYMFHDDLLTLLAGGEHWSSGIVQRLLDVARAEHEQTSRLLRDRVEAQRQWYKEYGLGGDEDDPEEDKPVATKRVAGFGDALRASSLSDHLKRRRGWGRFVKGTKDAAKTTHQRPMVIDASGALADDED